MNDGVDGFLEPERIRRELATILKSAIRTARLSRGLTQERVAELVGVEAITVRRWELGLRTPRVGDLEVLAEVIGLPLLADTYAGVLRNPQTPNLDGHSDAELRTRSLGASKHTSRQGIRDG